MGRTTESWKGERYKCRNSLGKVIRRYLTIIDNSRCSRSIAFESSRFKKRAMLEWYRAYKYLGRFRGIAR
jgi:hypothetical protein